VFCSVLRCVAVCCSVLQCVAVYCSVFQCTAVSCSVGCSVCCSVCCSVLQCVAVCCSANCNRREHFWWISSQSLHDKYVECVCCSLYVAVCLLQCVCCCVCVAVCMLQCVVMCMLQCVVMSLHDKYVEWVCCSMYVAVYVLQCMCCSVFVAVCMLQCVVMSLHDSLSVIVATSRCIIYFFREKQTCSWISIKKKHVNCSNKTDVVSLCLRSCFGKPQKVNGKTNTSRRTKFARETCPNSWNFFSEFWVLRSFSSNVKVNPVISWNGHNSFGDKAPTNKNTRSCSWVSHFSESCSWVAHFSGSFLEWVVLHVQMSHITHITSVSII